MNVYQVVLAGYDGSTDKTDDKIVWIVAEEPAFVTELLDQMGVVGYEIEPTDLSPGDAGVDFIILKRGENTPTPIDETGDGNSLLEQAMKLEKDISKFCSESYPFNGDNIGRDRQYGCLLAGKLLMFQEIVPDEIIHLNLPENWEEIDKELFS